SFTPNNTSQSAISVVTSNPNSAYSSSLKTLIGELSTLNSACGYVFLNVSKSCGEKTTRLSGGVLPSRIIPNFIYCYFLMDLSEYKEKNIKKKASFLRCL